MQENLSTKVALTITIETPLDFNGDAEGARMAIEASAAYLTSLLYFMDISCQAHDLLDINTDETLMSFTEFREHFQNFCDLGNALTKQISIHTARLCAMEKRDANFEEEPNNVN